MFVDRGPLKYQAPKIPSVGDSHKVSVLKWMFSQVYVKYKLFLY